MATGKVMDGVFAINKPKMITSAQVLRDLQGQFNTSETFAPWVSQETNRIARESQNQQRRRREKGPPKVKIGHGGTLDPLAVGVLICGVGKGTKSLSNFLLCTKTYEAVILFGTATDSYDRVGKVLRTAPYEHVTKEMVEAALAKFRGKFKQLPPLFSALKMNGKPLYEYAREGKDLPREIERREVEASELELLEWMDGDTHPHVAPSDKAGPAEINLATKLWKREDALPAWKSPSKVNPAKEFERKKREMSESQDDLVRERPPASRRKIATPSQEHEFAVMSGGLPHPEEDSTPSSEEVITEEIPAPKIKGPPAAKIRMTVSSGFYVRSLCHDLGTEVGSAALMAELERTRQGEFEVGKKCLEYSDLEQGEKAWGPKLEEMLEDWSAKHGESLPQAGPNRNSSAPTAVKQGESSSSPIRSTLDQTPKSATSSAQAEPDALLEVNTPPSSVQQQDELTAKAEQ